jgi:outer membrane protein
MKPNGLTWLAAGAVFLLTASTAGAQQKITDAQIQDLIREAAARSGVTGNLTLAPRSAQAAPAAPGQTAPGAPGTTSATSPTAATVPLSLDDAIKLALDRNLDISVQRLNPQTFDFSLASLRAVYKPSLTSTVSQQSVTNPANTTISGGGAGSGIVQDTTTYNGGISQSVKWGGGTFLGTLNNNRVTSTSTTALFTPLYTPNWSAQYTQPLMRNFKIDANRENLVITKLNQDISEIQLQSTIINTLSNVRNAYWDYVFAVQSVEVARQSVSLAEQLVKDNQTRVDVGTMAPIDVIQAQSQAATARQTLATAVGTLRTNELALKRLIVAGTNDPNWSAEIDPTDRPDFTPATIDIPAAVKRALDARTDLAQVRKNLEVNNITLKFLHNQTLPQADFVARYGLVGQGGTQFVSTGSGINRQVSEIIPGGYSDALNTLFRNNYPTWSFALNVSYPLGTSAQEATLARAQLQSNQVEAQLKQIDLQIATDVTNAAVQIESGAERVQAAQAARQFAQRSLDAEQSKFQVGMSTNYFVIQAQTNLQTAQNNELQAILAYRKAQVEFERLQQTSLSSANITIVGR